MLPLMKKIVAAVAVALVIGAAVFYQHRPSAKAAQPCWGKLAIIAGAKDQWALNTGATSGAPVTAENILPYLGRGILTCHVAGASYIIGKVGEEPRCTVHGTISNFNPDK